MVTSSTDRLQTVRVGFYDIAETVGKGNFAVVKRANHRIAKSEVAIKIIDKKKLGQENMLKIYREVDILKRLKHPNVLKLYQVMETKNMMYIVTEYAAHGDLFDYISRRGRLKEEDARLKFSQIVSAVSYCHKEGIVHRDLKAENLLIDDCGRLKIADWGLANFTRGEHALSTWCGSPPYAAPEVFDGKSYTGPEIDVWSLGVVLYVLVCGALPFEASTVQLLRERILSGFIYIPFFVTAECEYLLRRMLVVNPSSRICVSEIQRHPWLSSVRTPSPAAVPSLSRPALSLPSPIPQPNEHVLRVMDGLGIDVAVTRLSLQRQAYDHHTGIYLLLEERLVRHRSSCPLPSGSRLGLRRPSRQADCSQLQSATASVTAQSVASHQRHSSGGHRPEAPRPPRPTSLQLDVLTGASMGCSGFVDRSVWNVQRPAAPSLPTSSSHTLPVHWPMAPMQTDFAGNTDDVTCSEYVAPVSNIDGASIQMTYNQPPVAYSFPQSPTSGASGDISRLSHLPKMPQLPIECLEVRSISLL